MGLTAQSAVSFSGASFSILEERITLTGGGITVVGARGDDKGFGRRRTILLVFLVSRASVLSGEATILG